MPTVDFGGGSSFTAQNISSNTTLATFDLAFVDASGGGRTMTMPSSPSDGDAVQIVATSTSGGNIDVSANTGQSVSGLTTLQNAGEAAVFRYRDSDSTWYGTTADVLDRFVDRSTGEVTAPINSQSVSSKSVITDELTSAYDHIVDPTQDDLQSILTNDVSAGESVWVGRGGSHTFDATVQLASNVSLHGAGYDSVVEPVQAWTEDTLILDVAGGSGITISGIRFHYNGSSNDDVTAQGIGNQDVAGEEGSHILVTNCWATGRINFVQGRGWRESVIANNIINTTHPANNPDPNLEGVSISQVNNTHDPKNCAVVGNTCELDENGNTGTDTAAIELDGLATECLIQGNTARFFPHGVQLDNGPNAPDACAVVGNTLEDLASDAMQIRGPDSGPDGGGSHHCIVGNNIHDCGGDGIVMNARRSLVANNILTNPTTGIVLSEFEAPVQDGNVNLVVSNYIQIPTTGIQAKAGVENYYIVNNFINGADTGIDTSSGAGYVSGNYLNGTTTNYALASGDRAAMNEPPVNPFTLSNVTTVRNLDADNTTVDELADVVATLIQDMGLT